jgi:hypothetical protein
MKIQADIVNGCYLADKFDEDTIILSDHDFYDALPSHRNGKIGAEIYDDYYFKIYEEYGIYLGR